MKRAFLILALVPSIVVAQRAPDKPAISAGKESYDALLRAEAPYIAKARATYPAAKKRYLAGLPRGYRFEVRKRLADPGGVAFEEVFIEIDAIKDGKVMVASAASSVQFVPIISGSASHSPSRMFLIGPLFIPTVAKKAIMLGSSSTHISRNRPNQSLSQPLAIAMTSFHMTSTLNSAAKLALASGGLSPSR
jgi:hypothetical protein